MFGFMFLFSPTFFWGGMSLVFLGGASWDWWWRGAGEPGPFWGPTSRLDFTLWAPPPLSPPLRGAGRAKQRKGLTRKEEAVGLRTEDPGVSPPFPCHVPGASEEGNPEWRPSAKQARGNPQRGVRFKRNRFFFNQKRRRKRETEGFKRKEYYKIIIIIQIYFI